MLLHSCGVSFQCTLDADKEFVLRPHMAKINSLFGGGTVEQIFNGLEQDGTDWAVKQLNTLKKMVSLLSLFAL